MARSVEAIPTEFQGVKYRSRLEARWAAFMVHLGLRFQYEREGYQLSCGWYVPDFWVPSIRSAGMYFEVKPADPSPGSEEWNKLDALCSEAGFKVACLTDCAPAAGSDRGDERAIWIPDDDRPPFAATWDSGWEFCQCPNCGRVGYEFGGMDQAVRVCQPQCQGMASIPIDPTNPFLSLAVSKAYEVARRQRFW